MTDKFASVALGVEVIRGATAALTGIGAASTTAAADTVHVADVAAQASASTAAAGAVTIHATAVAAASGGATVASDVPRVRSALATPQASPTAVSTDLSVVRVTGVVAGASGSTTSGALEKYSAGAITASCNAVATSAGFRASVSDLEVVAPVSGVAAVAARILAVQATGLSGPASTLIDGDANRVVSGQLVCDSAEAATTLVNEYGKTVAGITGRRINTTAAPFDLVAPHVIGDSDTYRIVESAPNVVVLDSTTLRVVLPLEIISIMFPAEVP